eukprot:gene7406-biopygen19554
MVRHDRYGPFSVRAQPTGRNDEPRVPDAPRTHPCLFVITRDAHAFVSHCTLRRRPPPPAAHRDVDQPRRRRILRIQTGGGRHACGRRGAAAGLQVQ